MNLEALTTNDLGAAIFGAIVGAMIRGKDNLGRGAGYALTGLLFSLCFSPAVIWFFGYTEKREMARAVYAGLAMLGWGLSGGAVSYTDRQAESLLTELLSRFWRKDKKTE